MLSILIVICKKAAAAALFAAIREGVKLALKAKK